LVNVVFVEVPFELVEFDVEFTVELLDVEF
jgi:hypothetical protein